MKSEKSPNTKKPILFRFVKFLVRVFYPKTEVLGVDNISSEPVIIVGNHTQMNGPIVGEIFFDDNVYTWCASQMMKFKEVPAYAYKDFWSGKPKTVRWFYKLLSYIIAPLSVLIFNIYLLLFLRLKCYNKAVSYKVIKRGCQYEK